VVIHWASRRLWKAISPSALFEANRAFVEAFGGDPTTSSIPSPEGLDLILTVDVYAPDGYSAAGRDMFSGDGGHGRGSRSGSGMEALPWVSAAPAQTVGNAPNALEINSFAIKCSELGRFVAADNATWTAFLRTRVGFVSKQTLVDPAPGPNCTVWTVARWLSHTMWKVGGMRPPSTRL
jgi:hypothetical protein